MCLGMAAPRKVTKGIEAQEKGPSGEVQAAELTPRCYLQLPEDLAEVVVDGVGAEVELRRDLRVGRAARRQAGHPAFLRCQGVPAAGADAWPCGFAGGGQFLPGPRGERGRAQVVEQNVCRA